MTRPEAFLVSSASRTSRGSFIRRSCLSNSSIQSGFKRTSSVERMHFPHSACSQPSCGYARAQSRRPRGDSAPAGPRGLRSCRTQPYFQLPFASFSALLQLDPSFPRAGGPRHSGAFTSRLPSSTGTAMPRVPGPSAHRGRAGGSSPARKDSLTTPTHFVCSVTSESWEKLVVS